MAQKSARKLPEGVHEIRRGIQEWRKTRKKRTAMPEPLWRAAAAMARAHGVYVIAKALGLSYESLKRRAAAEPEPGTGIRSLEVRPFVEIERPTIQACAPPSRCSVELRESGGLTMTIRVTEGHDVDVAKLAAELWNQRR